MSEIEPWARRDIEGRLARISQEENVRLLLAVESGSRAWGFPSPDSDYDVRFLYVRPWREYVGLRPVRDVIERPIVDDFDVNGWDIRKALELLLKHNAVVAEWLSSPIQYLPADPIVSRIAQIADQFFNPRGYALHYASLGRNNVARWIADAETIPAKRYFYALRPALSVRALRLNPEVRPPMELQALMRVSDLPASLEAEIHHLVALKRVAKEKAGARRSLAVEQLICDELQRALEVPERRDHIAFARALDDVIFELLASSRSMGFTAGHARHAR